MAGKRIQTIEEAEAVSSAARAAEADARASEFGRRGGKARWLSSDGKRTTKKQKSSDGKRTDPSDGNHHRSPVMESAPTEPISQ
jgi:hypothetical protein